MATNTTKLGLIKPDFTDVVDVTDLNSNADDIDAAVGATIVTSTTRPTVPFAGQTIFETDTDSTLVWNGTAWKEVSSIADGSITAAKLATTAGAVMVFDDAAARTTAIPTPSEGMVTYLKDTDALEKFTTEFEPIAIAPAILQVVSTTKSDTFSTASNSYTTVTGLTASITPSSASSKILVIASVNSSHQDGAHLGAWTVFRASTDLCAPTSPGSRFPALHYADSGGLSRGSEIMTMNTFNILDNPATTSSVTYSVRAASRDDGGTTHINRSHTDTDNAFYARAISTITVMEVAG